MNIFFKEISLISYKSDYNIKDIAKINVDKDKMLYELLLEKYEDEEDEFEVFVNNKKIKIENYDIKLNENDLVIVNKMPAGASLIVMFIVNILISLVLSYLNKPKVPKTGESKSVYSSNSSQIVGKLGQVFPIQYGTFRSYPIKITKDYKFYENNNEYHLLTCTLGIGDFNINNIYLNDTNINDLQANQVQYKIAGTGSKNIEYLNKSFNTSNKNLGYIVQECSELAGVDLNEQTEVGENVLNESTSLIKRNLINFNFYNGIYGQNNEGNDISVSVNISIKYIEIDDNGNETGYFKYNYLNLNMNERTPQRITVGTDLKLGRYKIKISRTDSKSNNHNKSCKIDSIYSIDNENDSSYLNDVSIISFLVKINESIASNSSFQINVDSTRTGNFNTLRDFIIDIWTNENYGMNESLEFLELKSQLDEEVSIYLDESESGLDQIRSVLKSFGYIIYPYLTKFIIKKEESQYNDKIIFSSKNISDISFTYRLRDDNEIKKGIKGRYIKSGDLNYTEYYFPANMNEYSEIILTGINNEEKAKEIITFIYDKENLIKKTCSITTDMLGFIPEINDRVGVLLEDIDDNYTLLVNNLDLINSEITIDQKIEINQDLYVSLEDENGLIYGPFSITNDLNEFTNIISFNNNSLLLNDSTLSYICYIGPKTEVFESYLVKDIESEEVNEDINKVSKIKINLVEYIDIYQS